MNYEILSIKTIQELADSKKKIKELEHRMDLAVSKLMDLPIFVLPNNQMIQADMVVEEINKAIEFLRREE